MSKLILYGIDISPPVRSCLVTLKALNIPYEYKIVNLFAGEHLTDEFQKHNPQHTVPVLNDNGIWISDSHAINAYLVDKYGKTDTLYPKDLHKRAVVSQRLYFDASILFMALRNISLPMFRNKITIVPKEKTANILEGYDLVEKFLAEHPYIAGDTLTIADFCCAITVLSLCAIVEIDAQKFPKTKAWLDRISQLSYFNEGNAEGCAKYNSILKSTLTEINI